MILLDTYVISVPINIVYDIILDLYYTGCYKDSAQRFLLGPKIEEMVPDVDDLLLKLVDLVIEEARNRQRKELS